MNERYPDATSEEIAREDTCIICREEMQAWATNPANNAQADGARLQNAVLDERSRPKKLPCGHILHFGCLRSWLERQQNCPTCRQPVITPNRIRIEVNRAAQAPRPPNHNIAHHHLHHHHEQRHQHVHRPIDHGLPAQAPVNQARYVRFGPLQLGFAFGRDRAAAVNPNGIENPPRPAGQQPDSNGNTNLPGPSPNGRQDIGGDQTVSARFTGQVAIQNHINEVEQLLSQELNTLRNTAEQLQTARALQNEIHRLQHQSSSLQTQEATSQAGLEAYQGFPAPSFVPPPVHQNLFRPLNHHHHVHPTFPQMGTGNVMSAMGALPQNQAFRAPSGQRPLTSSDANLPPGFALPDGWTLLPLQQNNIRVESSPPSSTVTWQVPTPRSATAPPLEPTGESIQEPQRDEPSTQNPHLQTWQEMANQAEAYQRLLRPENASNIARGGNASPNTQSGLGTLPNSHDPVQPSPLRQQNSLPPQSSSLPPMPSTRSVPLGPTVSATPGSNEGQESDHTPSSTAPALHDSTAESSKHVTNSSLSAHRRGPLQDTPEETQNGTIATDKGKGRAATVEDVPEELD
jgi:E3 ubiquitin-protein ligase synoviolin